MRVKSLFAVAILVAIGTAACGSSSKSSAGSVTSAPGSGATTSPGDTTSSDAGSTTTIKLSGSSSSDFCDLARADDKAFSNSSPAGETPSDLKKQYQELGPALQKASDQAPSAIKGDFKVFLAAFEPYLQALSKANYDVTKLDVSSLQGLDSPAVDAASNHIEQYFTQVCHITTPTS